MSQQATQGIESAIVLAPGDSLTKGWDSSLKAAFRASLRELLAVPKERSVPRLRALERPAKT